jgi:lysozyme family protein
MRASFDAILPKLFDDEGGYCNDAGDPGGPTKFGIIYADLVAWRGLPAKCSKAEVIAAVQAVTMDEAAAIYKAKYWTALRCDDMPAGVDYAVFDFGVNSDIARAARYLQGIVGAKGDGIVGGMTLAAVARMDPEKIIDALCDQRLGFLHRLTTWSLFGRGWKARVLHVHADALLMSRQTRTSVPTVVSVAIDAAPFQATLSEIDRKSVV